jgi:integrase
MGAIVILVIEEIVMGIQWMKIENVKGIRYYEHNTRIYKKRKDRSFALVYKLEGKTKSETLGWESDGWTVEKAMARLQELKQNQKTGIGPKTLAEKREQAKKQKEEEEIKAKEEESKAITFAQLYEKYTQWHKTRTAEKTWKYATIIYRCYFKKSLADKPIDTITLDDLQQIINKALEAGKQPATAKYVKATIRQMFNFAKNNELYLKDNIAVKIHIPAFDNCRTRFLTMEEVQKILSTLKSKSKQIYNMALFSILSGTRAGEIINLCWENVNFNTGFITLVDTKNKNKTRHIPMVKKVVELFKNLHEENARGPVFKNKDGKKMLYLSNEFASAVKELGFNDGVADPRQRVVFHTLRHSYASWLMMDGADLYVVKELLGHSTTAMTERYSHLSPEHLKKTAGLLNKYELT